MYTVKRAFLYVLKLAFIPSLLPFQALPQLFRRREALSSLFYLSELHLICFVVEKPSLLPFWALPHLFRRREHFSSTFPRSSSIVWSYRTRFFYLSELSLTCFVVENPFLLPFRTPTLSFGRIEPVSSTNQSPASLVSSLRTPSLLPYRSFPSTTSCENKLEQVRHIRKMLMCLFLCRTSLGN